MVMTVPPKYKAINALLIALATAFIAIAPTLPSYGPIGSFFVGLALYGLREYVKDYGTNDVTPEMVQASINEALPATADSTTTTTTVTDTEA
jgi:uncharacterized membrane protein YjjP (DUF1212 family)